MTPLIREMSALVWLLRGEHMPRHWVLTDNAEVTGAPRHEPNKE